MGSTTAGCMTGLSAKCSQGCMSSTEALVHEHLSGEKEWAHPRAPLGPLDVVELAVAAQLHLGPEAAHKGTVGHTLFGEVLELVHDDLPMHHYEALYMVCLQAHTWKASAKMSQKTHYIILENSPMVLGGRRTTASWVLVV